MPLVKDNMEIKNYYKEIISDPEERLTSNGSYPISCCIITQPNMPLELKDNRYLRLCDSQNGKYIAKIVASIPKKLITVTVYTLDDTREEAQKVWENTKVLSLCKDANPIHSKTFYLFGVVFNDGHSVFLDLFFETSNINKHQHLIITKDSEIDLPIEKDYDQIPVSEHCINCYLSGDEKNLYFLWSTDLVTSNSQESKFVIQRYSTKTWRHEYSWFIIIPYPRKNLYIRLLRPLFSDRAPQICIAHNSWNSITIKPVDDKFETFVLSTHDLASKRKLINGLHQLGISSKNVVVGWNNEGLLSYWDQSKKATFEPIASFNMELYHQFSNLKPKSYPCRTIRFSPAGQVITFITVSTTTVYVQIMLASNLQVIDNINIRNSVVPPGYHIWNICFSDSYGIILTGAVTQWAPSGQMKIMFCRIKGLYEHIRKIEEYFDSWEYIINNNVLPNIEEVNKWRISRSNFQYLVIDSEKGILDDYDKNKVFYWQKQLYKTFFCRQTNEPTTLPSAMLLPTRPENDEQITKRVIHLYTHVYPWDSSQLVYEFAIIEEYDIGITIVAIRIGGDDFPHVKPYIMRTLATMKFDFRVDGGIQGEIILRKKNNHVWLEFQRTTENTVNNEELKNINDLMNKQVALISELHHPNDAIVDFVTIMQSGDCLLKDKYEIYVEENPFISNSSNFMAFFSHLDQFTNDQTIQFGHRQQSFYAISKLFIWIKYCIKVSNVHMSKKKFIYTVAQHYDAIFNDVEFDGTETVFSCVFAGALNLDIIANQTILTDQFLIEYHKHENLIWKNSATISPCLPLALQIRPLGILSLMRHVCLWTLPFNDISASINHNYSKHKWLHLGKLLSKKKTTDILGANTTLCTVPFVNFCSYHQNVPSFSKSDFQHDFVDRNYEDWLYKMINEHFEKKVTTRSRFTYPMSPFSCLIDQISNLQSTDLRLAFFEIPWMKKLLIWKLETFVTRIFIKRLLIPMLIVFITNFLNSLLITLSDQPIRRAETIITTMIQLLTTLYLTFYELKQCLRQPRYYKLFYNYIDLLTITFSYIMVFYIILDNLLSIYFIAFSTMIMWFNLLLQLRFYQPIGVQLIVITDMIKGVGWYLLLLGGIILGFSFIPFFAFQLDPSELFMGMTNFLGSNYDMFQPQLTYTITQALFTLIIPILLINVLIALLSLNVENTMQMGQLKWLYQAALLIVEVERFFLTDLERIQRKDWFPIWFQYTVNERERHEWKSKVEFLSNTLGWPPEKLTKVVIDS
ncbi:11311_t:CDS:2 [Ambispora leptoticha]|uniref:11311_t:CDS:1 n=1 Tax=Ambispora leptoticha TaxID=144679 RepID=A0A9N9CGQ6_9GLOM|nr:11311_t:CDS:2 [Ambispora leptoticha]